MQPSKVPEVMSQKDECANVPMKTIGPVKITGPVLDEEVIVPLATYESPLWPSTNRGAKVSRLAGGIKTVVAHDCMTRSVVIEAKDVEAALDIIAFLKEHETFLGDKIAESSRFAKLQDWQYQMVGNLLYLRFSIQSGDASGHNMATSAAESALNWILSQNLPCHYVSISGNYCTDKKVSAVNGILGRGKYVVSEILIPRKVVAEVLKSTPEKMVNLHIKKNLIGTNIAGGLRTANAHFANVLLAFYLATGQDAANIVEGSQGIVHAEVKDGDLYFSATIPNVIVGSIGNGKDLAFAEENLKLLGCRAERKPGDNAKRLASIIGATVLCGELSLLAAQTNPGELMRTHFHMERHQKGGV